MNTPALPSFWMGGYEGADHVNGAGEALDMVAATGHDRRLDADYRAARRLGLRCVRESVGWRLAEQPDGRFDLTRAVRMAQAASRQGVHILWTLMHYGVPPDLTLLDDALIPRFARFAGAVARTLAPLSPAPRIYTPINEISFLSWAASATRDMGPAGVQQVVALEDSRVSGFQVKQRLVRAALAGMDAIRAADPQARFLHIEPVLHVAPCDAGNLAQCALAERITGFQWQTMDMLAGRMDPQLGGHPEALDLVGLNHYHSSQWEVPSEKRLPWHLRDPRRLPLSQLLGEVWRRYGRPMLVAETGHIGVGRAAWLHEIAAEAQRARAQGLPLLGLCLYPLLDRPDWNETRRWHRSGLWHLARPEARRLVQPYARALRQWRDIAAPPVADRRPGLLVLLPCGWEDWPAPREPLLQALTAAGPVRLLEPPRLGSGQPLLRRHGVAPGAELLVLHGHAAGWHMPPAAAELALLRGALQLDGLHHWACWLAGWRSDGHPAWWRELAGAGLVLQPDAAQPPAPELLRRARATLPPRWPPPAARRPHPQGYEAEEVEALLRDTGTPRLWLLAPPAPRPPAELAGRLRELAARWPGRTLLVDAAPPPTDTPWPAQLHWLGRVHDSLHAALAAAVQQRLPWAAAPGWPEADGPAAQDPVAKVDLVRQAVLQVHPARPGDMAGRL